MIDLDDGEMFEWVDEPAGGGESGYAHVNDHDFTWPRHALEDVKRLAVLSEVDPEELRRLDRVRQGDDFDDDV